MVKRVWRIVGSDSMKETFSRSVPAGALSDREVKALLQRLAARHLTDSEVVSASLRKNATGHASHLEIIPVGGSKVYGWMTTGSGPHYTATIREAE